MFKFSSLPALSLKVVVTGVIFSLVLTTIAITSVSFAAEASKQANPSRIDVLALKPTVPGVTVVTRPVSSAPVVSAQPVISSEPVAPTPIISSQTVSTPTPVVPPVLIPFEPVDPKPSRCSFVGTNPIHKVAFTYDCRLGNTSETIDSVGGDVEIYRITLTEPETGIEPLHLRFWYLNYGGAGGGPKMTVIKEYEPVTKNGFKVKFSLTEWEGYDNYHFTSSLQGYLLNQPDQKPQFFSLAIRSQETQAEGIALGDMVADLISNMEHSFAQPYGLEPEDICQFPGSNDTDFTLSFNYHCYWSRIYQQKNPPIYQNSNTICDLSNYRMSRISFSRNSGPTIQVNDPCTYTWNYRNPIVEEYSLVTPQGKQFNVDIINWGPNSVRGFAEVIETDGRKLTVSVIAPIDMVKTYFKTIADSLVVNYNF